MKIIESDNPRMATIPDDVLDTLEKAIRTVDPGLSISKVDYASGTVSVAITYNWGTPDQWTDGNFLQVNVNADSVAAAFRDVYAKAYDRCI